MNKSKWYSDILHFGILFEKEYCRFHYFCFCNKCEFTNYHFCFHLCFHFETLKQTKFNKLFSVHSQYFSLSFTHFVFFWITWGQMIWLYFCSNKINKINKMNLFCLMFIIILFCNGNRNQKTQHKWFWVCWLSSFKWDPQINWNIGSWVTIHFDHWLF